MLNINLLPAWENLGNCGNPDVTQAQGPGVMGPCPLQTQGQLICK